MRDGRHAARSSCSAATSRRRRTTGLRPRARRARGRAAAARAGGARAHRPRHRPARARARPAGASRTSSTAGCAILEAAHVKDFLAALRLADAPPTRCRGSGCCSWLEGVGPARRAPRPRPCCSTGGARARSGTLAGRRAELPASAREPALNAARRRDRGRRPATAPPGPAADRLRAALDPLVRGHYVGRCRRACRTSQRWSTARPARRRTCARSSPRCCSTRRRPRRTWPAPPHLDEDWLVLSTVHSAKGLEWQSVHVLAAYDGNFPADMAAGQRASRSPRSGACCTSRMTRARRRCASTCRSATTTARTDAATRTATESPRGFSRRRCRPCATSFISRTTRPADRSAPRPGRRGESPCRSTTCSRSSEAGVSAGPAQAECLRIYGETPGSTAIASIDTSRPRGNRTWAGAERAGGGSGMCRA